MKRPFLLLVFLAVLGFLAYATIVSHASRPCLVKGQDPCTKALQQERK